MLGEAIGVSHSTVSRAIHGDPRISNTTREMVLSAARKLNYDPVARNGCWTIGLISCLQVGNASGYYAALQAAVSKAVLDRGFRLELISSSNSNIYAQLISGAIAIDSGELVQHWKDNFTLPLVRINDNADLSHNICSVCCDGAHSARIAVKRLLKEGHRRICFVSFSSPETERTRITRRWPAFLETMRNAGIPDPERLGVFFPRQLHDTEQSEVTGQIRRAVNDGCTAFINVDDGSATLRIYAAICALNLKIPSDVSVIDWEFQGVSEFLNPPHTTIRHDYQTVSVEAVNMLEEMLESNRLPQRRYVPSVLIERGSVAPPRTHEIFLP